MRRMSIAICNRMGNHDSDSQSGQSGSIRLVLFDFAIYWGMSEKEGNAYQWKKINLGIQSRQGCGCGIDYDDYSSALHSFHLTFPLIFE
jgi:hypothetical protein